MKKIVFSSFTIAAISLTTTLALASDYADEVKDIERSISAIEKQLDSMDVNYNSNNLEFGLNRSQKVRELESKYESLQTIFNNNYVAY
ncbi:hypothetical protein MED121_15594 [Marinomonas sp. MED121]|uniref:hypothetical protein n=1 Tax=Marinomonas sp. MED121 TaxID=314277 RepID=UPI00006911EC|nr:hypothetical protein [Marinomonas sp. MED121]EAQ67364.1 hypothetical protein MED121_15594 [Marinomonas sp. MED121]